jgi:abhydrolase domain-containing protein 2
MKNFNLWKQLSNISYFNILHIFIYFFIVGIFYRYLFCKTKIKLIFQKTQINNQIINFCNSLTNIYRYPIWGSNGHLQTFYASILRKTTKEKYNREYIRAEDGGIIVLDWHKNSNEEKIPIKSPPIIIVIVPGICNNSESHYIMHFSKCCKEHGFSNVVFHTRGTAELFTPKLFTCGDTNDLNQTMNYLYTKYHLSKFVLIGFSMGGNIVVKYLGEKSTLAKSLNIIGGISICQGYDGLKDLFITNI